MGEVPRRTRGERARAVRSEPRRRGGGALRSRLMAAAALWLAVWLAGPQLAQAQPPRGSKPQVERREASAGPGSERAESALSLREVLRSVDADFPGLAAADRKLQAAAHRVRSARGSFDVKLKAAAQVTAWGKYAERAGKLSLEQSTPLWGAEWSAGYENGADFPVYGAKQETSEYGQWFVGLRLPLLEGRAIDAARTGRELAELSRRSAELQRTARRLKVRLAAVDAYLGWVGAGAQHRIAERLLRIAEDRQAGVELQIERGAIPPLEALDNRRLIAIRREKQIATLQRLQQAALELSLYRRDASGRPHPPGDAELPAGFPGDLEAMLGMSAPAFEQSLERRPDLALLAWDLRALGQKLSYWDNRTLPSLDASVKVTSGLGPARSYAPFAETQSETRALAQLDFELPLQRRKALGEAAALRADIGALQKELSLRREQAHVELRKGWLAVQGARRRAEQAELAARASLELEEAERQRFAEGLSNVFTVNLREAASADAEGRSVAARFDYYFALAKYRAMAAAL